MILRKLIQIKPILFSLLLMACTNKYEKNAIGTYESNDQISRPNSNVRNSIFLKLGEDKYCSLSYGKKSFHGKWRAYDNGDHTIIEIYSESKEYNPVIEGYLGNGLIELWSHSDSLLNEYDKVLFKRKRDQ